jgi:hypothetical protein
MGLFGPNVNELARRGDVAGLIALLGSLDKKGIDARHALVGMGRSAVPALLEFALSDESTASDALSPQVAAALTVLVMIGRPTLDAAVRAVATSESAQAVGTLALLIRRTALDLGMPVPDAVKREVAKKTARDWAEVSGEWLDEGRGPTGV